ncbi:class I SAM-dependent methyltransferase [Bdellovibrio sp.]|uniref:class I SAM-dependent methyltransferase n=1 Tax=Bdellovibrio sp. TaxID=28201 RepID=UPI0039E2CA08
MPKDSQFKNQADEIKYWNEFYKNHHEKQLQDPSEFAKFISAQKLPVSRLIEVGCGNGRDTIFLSKLFQTVVGIDTSPEAIAYCKQRHQAPNINFINSIFAPNVDDILNLTLNSPVLVYGRFLLHALDSQEEADLLKNASTMLSHGSYLAFEYRTTSDEKNKKTFGNHFRRYIKHDQLCDKLKDLGFKIIFENESDSFAQFAGEKSNIGRCIARI